MFVIAKYHNILRRLGLDSLRGVKEFRGEQIKDHKGRRDIIRITVPPSVLKDDALRAADPHSAARSPEPRPAQTADSGSGPNLVLYLKRNWKPYRKDGLKSLFTRGEVWSQSRVEWENAQALQRAGLCVAEPIAFGEECALLREKFSFLLTAAARGEIALDEFLRTCADPAQRRRVFDALAREIRKMHDAGLASPDLFTRHIFLERGGEPKFCLIDTARLDRRKNLPLRLRARDLAALHLTAPLRFVSSDERKQFLEVYGGNAVLEKLIKRRTEHLLKRRKFAAFSGEHTRPRGTPGT